MFLQQLDILKNSFVTDIVRQDYRTASVFRKYDIDFCCGGKWPLGLVCETKGLDFDKLKTELKSAIRPIKLSNTLQFDKWDIDFLTEYIINIHHCYLRDSLPQIKERLTHFAKTHTKQYSYLPELLTQFDNLYNEFFPHLDHEEKVLFPYIIQIAHAYQSKESYASLLVKTLRKPVEKIMLDEHESVAKILHSFRHLTHNYTLPEKACVSHQVTFSLLKELDNDFVQHLYLENQILFPKVIAMEKELLGTSQM
jgi:regulator of cell morphogenesis and NO signaling